jgi:signal transduction histidine kinase
VRGIGDLYEPLADDKGLALTVDAAAPAWVRGNRELISQALANLVDNAIKYGASGGAAANGSAANGPAANGHPAEIVLAATERDGRIRLSVADRGPGIAQADRARVLERFVRLEQSRSEPGSGLGLSLAAAIARLHDGELILADNHPGLLSTISLPRAAAPVPAPVG